jgi:hypothetical protein
VFLLLKKIQKQAMGSRNSPQKKGRVLSNSALAATVKNVSIAFGHGFRFSVIPAQAGIQYLSAP